jgi:hypothetical protein
MSGEMIAYCMKDKALEIERELTAVTEQRDRLAEALHVINTYDPKNGQCDDGYSPVFHARKALQSLTTNAQAMASADENTPPKESTL